MFYAKNFKTPTLVLHGELDYRVPYGNGLELYGVLQAMSVPLQDEYAASRVSKAADEQVETTTWPLALAW
jgi:predicted esterase